MCLSYGIYWFVLQGFVARLCCTTISRIALFKKISGIVVNFLELCIFTQPFGLKKKNWISDIIDDRVSLTLTKHYDEISPSIRIINLSFCMIWDKQKKIRTVKNSLSENLGGAWQEYADQVCIQNLLYPKTCNIQVKLREPILVNISCFYLHTYCMFWGEYRITRYWKVERSISWCSIGPKGIFFEIRLLQIYVFIYLKSECLYNIFTVVERIL